MEIEVFIMSAVGSDKWKLGYKWSNFYNCQQILCINNHFKGPDISEVHVHQNWYSMAQLCSETGVNDVALIKSETAWEGGAGMDVGCKAACSCAANVGRLKHLK